MKLASKLALLGLPLALVACSTLEGEKVDYKTVVKAQPLSIPPDLTQLPRDNRYVTPGGTVSATGLQNATQNGTQNTVASTFAGMRLEGRGGQRWLVVDQPPEQLWPAIRTFWVETGFKLELDDARLGIMETDWNENRAKLPQDFIRRTLGKLVDSLYSSGELDKYRTRVERNAASGTEIYISHRGLMEEYKDVDKTKTTWVPRPADAELEIEMLRRLMIKLGAAKGQADQQTAALTPQRSSSLDSRDGQPLLLITETFDRAWRRVGLSLDRTGFTVEDRDRSQGTYFVRYVEPARADQQEPGFFARIFSETPKDKTPQKYRITVRSQGDSSTVSVLNAEGGPELSDNARRILKVIADDLR